MIEALRIAADVIVISAALIIVCLFLLSRWADVLGPDTRK